VGKEKVHFQASDSLLIEKEMNQFLDWFRNNEKTDLVLKATLAHF